MRCWQKLWSSASQCLKTDSKGLIKNIAGIIIFVIFYIVFIHTVGYPSINLDESLPGKLYWTFPHPDGLKQGDTVVFRFKGSRYFPHGAIFIKKVACIPKQKLVEKNRCFTCNGKPIGCAKERDRKGNPAPLFKWNGIIPPGKYFVVGTSRDSYDSKYWGFVDKTAIIGKAYRIF